MKRFRMGRPSPAMVVAVVAVVAVITGTAYAATKIGTKQLKNKAVTTKKSRTARSPASSWRPAR